MGVDHLATPQAATFLPGTAPVCGPGTLRVIVRQRFRPRDLRPHEAVQARDAQARAARVGIFVVGADVVEVVAVVKDANRDQPMVGAEGSGEAVGHAEAKN